MIRWTPLILLRPHSFVDTNDTFWGTFDLERWSSEEYEYQEDPLGGWFDHAQNPRTTIMVNKGDCEDYALVAASWALARGRMVKLTLCFEGHSPVPKHAVAFDGKRVYSSGDIMEYNSLDEYVTESSYDWYLSRRL